VSAPFSLVAAPPAVSVEVDADEHLTTDWLQRLIADAQAAQARDGERAAA
jgi:hypothetical protein